MPDILHRIGVRAAPAAVHAALASPEGLARWWTTDARGAREVGGRLDLDFRDAAGRVMGSFALAITALEPGRLVRWRVEQGPPEWVGTAIEFLLVPSGPLTIVRFAHRGWREEVEFLAHCSMKWATFLLSLRAAVETGTGRPAPGDLKIDDWN